MGRRGGEALKLDAKFHLLTFQKLLSLKIKSQISDFPENENKTTSFYFLGHQLAFPPGDSWENFQGRKILCFCSLRA